MLQAIPFTLMRGGTSKGPYFLASDLPADPAQRDRLLLKAMGSPDIRQIDGIGGATTLTSKVAMVSPSVHPDADVDYLFAQVSVDEPIVDTAPSCGNILSGVGPFAIEQGLVPARQAETKVRIRNINTHSFIDAIVQTPNGQVTYEGDAAIDGVPGTAAPVLLNFKQIVGSKTGKLLPTDHLQDTIHGVEVTCIDVAVPMVLFNAALLGKTGQETKAELDADTALIKKMQAIRQQASQLMGLGDCTGKVIPKMALLSASQQGGNITSRYFVPTHCHAAHAVTGAICVAVCSALPGSIAAEVAVYTNQAQFVIEHPSGKIAIALDLQTNDEGLSVNSAGVVRTCRKIARGELYVMDD